MISRKNLKSVSMRVEEYNYLCSINTSVNSLADYHRQYAYFYSTPATYQPAVTPFFKQPAQTFSQVGLSFGSYTFTLLNHAPPPATTTTATTTQVAINLTTAFQVIRLF